MNVGQTGVGYLLDLSADNDAFALVDINVVNTQYAEHVYAQKQLSYNSILS